MVAQTKRLYFTYIICEIFSASAACTSVSTSSASKSAGSGWSACGIRVQFVQDDTKKLDFMHVSPAISASTSKRRSCLRTCETTTPKSVATISRVSDSVNCTMSPHRKPSDDVFAERQNLRRPSRLRSQCPHSARNAPSGRQDCAHEFRPTHRPLGCAAAIRPSFKNVQRSAFCA
eukprot:3119553-Pleurochrysis_carterae.AAC.1